MASFLRGFLTAAVFSALLSAFASCVAGPEPRQLAGAPEETPLPGREQYPAADYKGKNEGEKMPEWVRLYLEAGTRGVETLEIYQNHYTFVSRVEGNNFNAFNLWMEGFSPELDFPRMAAARIEARFLLEAALPDDVYGVFFEELIRAASDASWERVLVEDNFWLRREAMTEERGSYEFFILVSIEKPAFASRLDRLFRSLRSLPLTGDQIDAVNNVISRFYEGF